MEILNIIFIDIIKCKMQETMVVFKNCFQFFYSYYLVSFFATLKLIKFLSDHIHPFEQAFFRNIISIIIILPFVIKYDLKIQNKKILGYFFSELYLVG